jgi:hypothetical protein
MVARTLRDAVDFLVTSVVRDGICDAAAVLVRDGKMLQLATQAGMTPPGWPLCGTAYRLPAASSRRTPSCRAKPAIS